MKHGVAFRKLSRTSSHRMLMLRNMVTSLVEHEQIKTTLPKAREAARLAEKLITLGKKGGLPAARQAQGFLLKHSLIEKVFGTLANRYAGRPGGYTRIHKFGNRKGDNAPQAILELVDNPRDLKFEMTARAVGWELLGSAVAGGSKDVLANGVPSVEHVVRQAKKHGAEAKAKPGYLHEGLNGRLRRTTQDNLRKVLRYGQEPRVQMMMEKAQEHMKRLLASPLSHPRLQQQIGSEGVTSIEPQKLAETVDEERKKQLRAGGRLLASDKSAFSMSYGGLNRRRKPGLGLPGSGWFDRQRAMLRESERARA